MKVQYGLTIKFDKANNTYRPGDYISGQVIVNFTDPNQKKVDITSFKFRSEGSILPQNKDTHKELERVCQQLLPTSIHMQEGDLTKEKLILQEKNVFPFKYQFIPQADCKILETYVGVYVTVAYEISVELIFNNGLAVRNAQPFFAQVGGQGLDRKKEEDKYPKQEHFRITPDKLQGNSSLGNKSNVKFSIEGVIDTTICQFLEDFHGSIQIQECESDIRTIDLQMIRVERIETKNGKIKEATEIQLIQIIDGNATKRLDIPYDMIFPKYFSCPNFQFREYTVDFEVNLVIIMYDGFKVTLNFPIIIFRK